MSQRRSAIAFFFFLLAFFFIPAAAYSAAMPRLNGRGIRPAAVTLVVNSTGDDSDALPGDGICATGGGVCTFRAAIEESNALTGVDTINFSIGSGHVVIAPASTLPDITESVTIDGSTQPGYGSVPLIELDGHNVPTTPGNRGLNIQPSAPGTHIRALMINRFPWNAIEVSANGCVIDLCTIGTDATATQNLGNGGAAISIFGTSNNVISHNVLAFSAWQGVVISESGPSIYPLFPVAAEATDVFTTLDFNDNCGVWGHLTGGTTYDPIPGAGGVPFTDNFGMRLSGTITVAVAGNYTFDFTQLDDLGRLVLDGTERLNVNAGDLVRSTSIALTPGSYPIEIDMWEGAGSARLLFNVSGPSPATFTFGGNPGLQGEMFRSRAPAEGNTITNNSIFNNVGGGINLGCCCYKHFNDAGDLDVGPNTLLNYPEFTNNGVNLDGSIRVDGTASPGSIVEIFACADTNGGGEGKQWLTAVNADAGGVFHASFVLPGPFYLMTATATDTAGNTSEFSPAFQLRGRPITVTSTADSGPGTLRSAIDDANSDGMQSVISFDPTMSGVTISLLSPLSALTGNDTTINGDINGDCHPDVALVSAGPQGALLIQSSGNVIRGLAFSGFGGQTLVIEGATAGGNRVVCNYFGTGLSGTTVGSFSQYGVVVRNGSANNTIGAAGEGNLFVGFNGAAVQVDHADNNTVAANLIGLDAAGVPNPPAVGIHLLAANTNMLGGTTSGNRIVAKDLGIHVQTSNGAEIYGNTIGWPAAYTPRGAGIFFNGGSTNGRVGHPNAPGSSNRIENNGGSGVAVENDCSTIAIRRNAISHNGGLGIDLDNNGVTPNDGAADSDGGANAGQNFPIITTAWTSGSSTVVKGFVDTVPGTYSIDFFVSTDRDSSGYGEGAEFLWSGSVSPGEFNFGLPAVPVGAYLTATLTDPAGNTSEFSLAFPVTAPAISATELVAYATSMNSIVLRWRDPQASETGFRIERMFEGGGWAWATTVGPDTTTWTDAQLVPNQTWRYRVIATSAAGPAPASNIAVATTWNGLPSQICKTQVGPIRQSADSSTVAWNGTSWGVAWSDRRSGREADIFFQLANPDGSPSGSQIQITSDDTPSLSPVLSWNGANFGLMWLEHARGPAGEMMPGFSFALLGPNGNKLRGDLRVRSGHRTFGSLNPDGQQPLVWDGSGWGIFLQERTGNFSDIYFYRLDANGNVVVGGVPFVQSSQYESSVSAAWNGSEYGVAWVALQGSNDYRLRFQRMNQSGVPIGGVFEIASANWPVTMSGTSLIAEAGGWALAWGQNTNAGSKLIRLARLDGNGNPLAGSVLLSDNTSAVDEFPKLLAKPGGGYVVYTTSVVSGVPEVGRLEANSSGNRVGSRMLISQSDGIPSSRPSAASDTASFLVAWNETRTNGAEIAEAPVAAGGAVGTIRDLTTTHGGPRAGSHPLIERFPQNNSGGFVVLLTEDVVSSRQIRVRIYKQDGSFVVKAPLNAANLGHPADLAVGANEFGVAWTDATTNGIHFDRFDVNGDTLMAGGVQLATGGVDRGAAVAYSGEAWGVAWAQSGVVNFQMVGSSGVLGSPVAIPAGDARDPQIRWVGSGWVVVWRDGDFQLTFARLDPSGALVVPPVQIAQYPIPDFRLLWTGVDLAMVSTVDTDAVIRGGSVKFTILDLNGVKRINDLYIALGSTPTVYFDGSRYHVIYQSEWSGLSEQQVSALGELMPGTTMLSNHDGGWVSVAFDGATAAMVWEDGPELQMQTTACLTDTTPPPCPSLNHSFNGAVQLSWSAVSDPQSAVIGYHLYRDGTFLTELRGNTTAFTDGGFTPGAGHNYELRAFNGANLASTGCEVHAVTAGILLSPNTLTNGRQNSYYSQTITASQGVSPYTFGITGGALPGGLSLNSGTGVISGQPPSTGLFSFTVTATDSAPAPQTGSRAYTVRICPSTTFSPTVLPDPIVNAPYRQIVRLLFTPDPVTFSVTTGALPAGLTLAADGTISGTPTTQGTYNFTITGTESTGCTTAQAYSFTVISGTAARDVVAYPQSSSSILVQWDRPLHGETGFRIERSLDGSNWGSVNVVGSDVTSHLDQGLTPGTLYFYRVVAFAGAFDSTISNSASASTFPAAASKICHQTIGPFHARAQYPSVAHNGTQWAAAWSDRRDNLYDEIYFQFLDNTTGAPVGSPLRITQTDMQSRFPMIRWNGSQFGVLYSENVRGPAGEVNVTTNFALLDAAGSVVRKGVYVTSTGGRYINSNYDLPFVWDGGGWGVFFYTGASNPPADLWYLRLTPTGDVATGPVRLTSGPGWEADVSVAVHGSEYGLAWIETHDSSTKLWFQRMQTDGTLIGTAQPLESSGPNEMLYAPNLVWNATASEWAIAFGVSGSSDNFVRLQRLNADGSPKASAVRVSNNTNPNEDEPVDDELPQLAVKPGGYFIFTVSGAYSPAAYKPARLEADASGNRVGARVFLAPNDGNSINVLRTATDGTRFMLAYNLTALNNVEVQNVMVDSAGAVAGGPTTFTTGHAGGSSAQLALTPFESGFLALWNEAPSGGGAQLFARAWDGAGNQRFARTPLSATTGVRSKIAAGTVGSKFSVVWRDANSLRYCRYDSGGNPVIPEVVLPSGGNQPAMAWNGEAWGLVFYEGNMLRFQRLFQDGSTVGPKVFIGNGSSGHVPQIQWVGTGWAIVWRQYTNLYYSLLDRNGAAIVPPLQVTMGSTSPQAVQAAWSGERLGLVWSENRGVDPPGADIYFTALKLDGTKAFVEKAVVSTPYGDSTPAIYWDRDRFRIVFASGLGVTNEIAVQSDGTVLPGERLLEIRSPAMSIAWNGVTLGMLYVDAELTLQTSGCLEDASAPPCPSPNANFDGQKVRISWSAVSDSGSIIAGYNVYRDGKQLAELLPGTLYFDDFGFVPGSTHVYEVRAINGSNLESSGCSTRAVVAGITVLPATLPDESVGNNYTQTLSGSQGSPQYTFAVTSGSLPPGLSLNATTGQLSGKPTTGGAYTFTVTVTDSLSRTGSRAYTLRICGGIAIYPTLLAYGYTGVPYSQTFVPAGLVGGSPTWSLAGSLPPGLTMDTTGWISGTPTVPGTYNFTISLADPIGCSTSRSLTIIVVAGTGVRLLSATALSTSSIRLRWSDPQRNETGFRIERSLDLGVSWTPIAIAGADTTTYTDPSLSASTTYSYRVVAITPAGDAASSPVATATTPPATAAKVCMEQVSPYHSMARSPSVAFTGTQWAMAYSDRTGGEDDEIYFTFLSPSGVPAGTPVRITDNDTNSLRPILKWNGSKFGLMWQENVRTASGDRSSVIRFALLDGTGNLIRRDVAMPWPAGHSSSTEMEFLWDGTAWAYVISAMPLSGSAVSDLYLYRLDEDGDVIAGPHQLTTHADFDLAPSLAWNGSEYGVAWARYRDNTASLWFERVSQAGAILGTPTPIASSPGLSNMQPDVVPAAAGWTVFWTEALDNGSSWRIYMRRLNTSGAPLASAQQVSDDFDLNGYTASDGKATNDMYPEAFVMSGGGYTVFTRARLASNNRSEVGMLRADAAGSRIGLRTIVSPIDIYHSGSTRVAFDGTNFLVVYNDHRLGTQEIASVVVNQAGSIVAGPTDMTTGHSPGNNIGQAASTGPQVAPVGSGFAALWVEPVSATSSEIWAKFFDGSGTLVATRSPLSTRATNTRPAVVSVGSTFATVWKDSGSNVVFGRYDATGTPLITEVNVATSAGGTQSLCSVGFDGEGYGVMWNQNGRLQFQRVSAAGASIAPRSTIALMPMGPPQQMVWTGSGWAIVFVSNNDVYYTLLDINGAIAVPPMRVTFTPDNKEGLAIAWSGEVLGIAFATRPPVDPPGLVVDFTAVNLEGIKQFSEVRISEGRYDISVQALNWNGDRFQLSYLPGESGYLREIDITPAGTFLGSSRVLAYRGSTAAVVFNGATSGMLWNQYGDLYFGTTACLADTTPPPCPTASASRSAGGVTVTWSPVFDAESGIWRYLVYRDDVAITETFPSTTQYFDAGISPAATASYRVVAMNNAYLTPTGCASLTPMVMPVGLAATAVATAQVQITWSAVTGADHYVVERSSDGVNYTVVGSPTTNTYNDSTVQAGRSYLYHAHAANGTNSSGPSNLDLATAVVFSDDPVSSGMAPRAVYLAEARAAAAAVRELARLPAPTWTDSAAAGLAVKAVHMTEIRNAINDARTALGLPAFTFTDSISPGVAIKALHMQELRNAVK